MTVLLETIFWVLAAFVGYTYLGYPCLVFLLSRFRPARARRIPDSLPEVTIVIPAYNEEAVIEAKLKSCLELDYPKHLLNILVVSDGSSDRTVPVARNFRSEHVRILSFPVNRGKNLALNEAMGEVRTAICVISDASVLLDRESLRTLVEAFSDDGVGGVWGKKVYRNVRGTAGGEGESMYLKYGNLIKEWESRLGSIVSAEGSLFAFRTKLYDELPAGVADDFFLSTMIVRQGYRIEYEKRALSYEETTPTNLGEFRRKSRIIQQAVKGIYLSRDLLNPARSGLYAIQFLTVKVFRRAAALMLVLLFFCTVLLSGSSFFFRVLLYFELAFLGIAALGLAVPGGRGKSPVLAVPAYLCLVNLAAISGFIGFLLGRDVTKWKPTERLSDVRSENR